MITTTTFSVAITTNPSLLTSLCCNQLIATAAFALATRPYQTLYFLVVCVLCGSSRDQVVLDLSCAVGEENNLSNAPFGVPHNLDSERAAGDQSRAGTATTAAIVPHTNDTVPGAVIIA